MSGNTAVLFSSLRMRQGPGMNSSLLQSLTLSINMVYVPTLQQGDTPLYWAARNGHLDVVQYLCEEDIAINTKDTVRVTPPSHPPPPCCVTLHTLCYVMLYFVFYAMFLLCVMPCYANRLVRRRCTSLRGMGIPMC